QDKFPVCKMRHDACSMAMGTASAGPKAGANKMQLCEDSLKCVYNSNCADIPAGGTMMDADTLSCLCGAGVMLEACTSGSGLSSAQGMCKAELSGAAESMMAQEVSTRLGDPTYAAGLAIRAVQCAQRYCPKTCGLCASTDATCVDMVPMP
ncbi:MAG TPA: hypothetical protein VJV78_30025, partial [Polyangiales bacterium]|nr:hypothetical protein [Polyangiales bacterium]